MTMSTHAIPSQSANLAEPVRVGRIDAAAPFEWLAAGVRDFAAAPWASLLYGALFSLLTAGTLYLTWELPGLTVAFLTGLLLIGPVLAAGLYAAARQWEAGERTSIAAALSLIVQRRANLGLFAIFLALVMAAWVRLSALLFALKFNSFSIAVEGYTGVVSGSGDPVALGYFLLIGFALALTVFVTSAVAIPMILDRDCSPVTAVQTSSRAFAKNWPSMLVWAALILVLTATGIATGFLGMLAVFPVLGYATWHSYRALVG
jgi:uncharacterized membrane protein